jgi:cytochrome c oxidase subunit 2
MVALVALLTSCGPLGSAQNTLNPSGDVADRQANLFWIITVPAAIIMVLVFAGLIYALLRFRRRDDSIPEQMHGNMRLELTWTILPALLLVGLAIPTVDGIIDLGRDASDDALHVRVVAFQWDWRFEYLDPEFANANGDPMTSDELYVPVDREVGVDLHSLDVIHSFWVPKLAGKKDVMPGRTNKMWFNATEPGTFSGQCAEFCGIGHSAMRFDVIALEQPEFDAWVEEQLAAQ